MERSLQDRDRVGVQDAILLEDYTNQKVFVENLEKRFNGNAIYTYIGQVLVSVNPYKELNIYTPSHVKAYQNKHAFENAPHVFALSDLAYRALLHENRDQCVLISGESGSGKTEASKKILQYVADVTDRKGNVENVKNKLLQSNPVLEAFGNARTNRNDNSSRFGKYMDIEFNFEGNPVGGNILNYLLEKSRVINQVPGERNFHIFYQLLAGAEDSRLEDLDLKRSPENYFYLSNGSQSNTNLINDASGYHDVVNALSVIEFTETEKNDMFNIVASILHLGNVKFVEDEGIASINKLESVESISKLLGCSVELLRKSLTHRTREARKDVVTSPLNKETSIYARDALAKAIYDRLFTWLVNRINTSLQAERTNRNQVMGILDIYGFEIFETNSFEQLCINFCNEKLQQLFIELTLKSEQEEYLREGIEWQNIEYFDNKVICDLVEEKHKGIIAIMDEECLRPGDATDMTLLMKMNQNLHSHKHYISHQKADAKLQKKMRRDEFQLVHYAGTVTYNVKTFIEKNNDLLFRDLKDAMINCKNSIVNSIFTAKEQESMKRPETAITQFKNSLNKLMKILIVKEPNYIRCIKPNDHKSCNKFDEDLVNHQVTYLGLMENLRVRRAGFAYRRTYELFLERYKCLAKETWPHYHGSAKDGVQVLVCKLGYEKDDYRMGKTKVFIRYPKTLFETEDAYQAKKHDIASYLQAHWKGYLQRKKYLHFRTTAIIVQKWIRRFLARRRAEKRKQAVVTIRKFVEGFITRNGPKTDLNRKFVELAKFHWLNRLAKALPKSVLVDYWPPCPHSCQEASALLKKMHRVHLSRVYRYNLTSERKRHLKMKVLAEKVFDGQKKSYKASIPYLFKTERISEEIQLVYKAYVNTLQAEKIKYSTMMTKYDRHGYKPRDRVMIITNANVYIVEIKNSSTTMKHKLQLQDISLVITSENDKMLMIKLPEELIKKEKGDIILEVPHLIECVTQIIAARNDPGMLTIEDKKNIEHKMVGKQGIIDVKLGRPESIVKDKSGHLLITASP
ncbi:unconventional myosin IC [Atheta coriaria]|uniref:unconventional myosin IC n=1 Tax=Dalotia coriaria TaxID=877792 RepID=UPI0031F43C5B